MIDEKGKGAVWRRAVWLTIGLALVGGVASAEELGAEAVFERLQLWLDGTRDLEARFVQKLASGALGSGLEESGELFLARPGRMRWNYLEPERKVALIDGETTRLYVEEDRQLWEGRLEAEGALLPLLLTEARPLAELFVASLVATPEQGGDGAYRLRLVPRAEDDRFRQVVLTLDPPRCAIRGADVLDGAGNRMLYRFSGLRRNRGLTPAVFHFEAPAGTEVVVRP